ncbi:hypothetical protein QA634_08140 [Methylobacterium sp. CB376]|uniref:hypothetical protein n=1 Tax=unclassified Methylobacterium TaxID=2615210 RepID=UPI001AEBD99C|nr:MULTISPECIES: hypothetical protein [Methylobacterium]WFT81816.1 hypothetical protein QA634_08140 [Methylobacterium nodulans]
MRTTPAASANTFGRPSKTKPTTPSGAATCSIVQPGCAARDHATASLAAIPPRAQARAHVAPHAVARDEAGGRAAGLLRARRVLPVGLRDRVPDRGILQERREAVEEPVDGLIRDGRQRPERGLRPVHSSGGQRPLRRGDVQEIARLLQHQQVVAGLEPRGEVRRDHRGAVAAEGHERAGDQAVEGGDGHARVVMVMAARP